MNRIGAIVNGKRAMTVDSAMRLAQYVKRFEQGAAPLRKECPCSIERNWRFRPAVWNRQVRVFHFDGGPAQVTVSLAPQSPAFQAAEDVCGKRPVTIGERKISVTVGARDAAVITLR